MEFVEIKDKQQWNSSVMSNPETDILQSWQWGEVKRIEGWIPYRFVLSNKEVGSPSEAKNLHVGVRMSNVECRIPVCGQILVKEVKFFGKIAYIPHGPFWNVKCGMWNAESKITNSEFITCLSVFREEIVKWAKQQDIFLIEIEPKIDIADSNKVALFKKAGFRITGRNIQPKYKLFLDITQTEEEILAGMKKNTRYNIRYAKNHGVEVKSYSVNDPEISSVIGRFHELVVDMQKRARGYPARSKKYFERFINEFKDSDNVKIFEVSHNNQVIAMNISEYTKSWASSFYAGSNRLYPNLKASYLLRWASILEAKKRGCQVYDFWGIIPNSKQHKGYSENKLSFGGKRVDFVGIWVFPLNCLKYYLYEFSLKIWRLYLSMKWR